MEIEWGAYYVLREPEFGLPPIVKVFKPTSHPYGSMFQISEFIAIEFPNTTGEFSEDDSGRILLAIDAWILRKATSLEIELA